ncbi:MAG: MFS transporter [Bacilli bacterium]|nr:MFS transporter [Bacilli bacterium]
MKNKKLKFNIFAFLSNFARSLIEIFISLFLFKNGFTIKEILLFYFLENFFAIFLAYIFVKIGERFRYSVVMFIGITSLFVFQVSLNYIDHSLWYLVLISFLYSMYRRGYWVSRKYYIAQVIPEKNSSGVFSITIIFAQVGSILAGYFGAYFLDKVSIMPITIISTVLSFISVIPLITIKYKKENRKIELIKNLKKYDKRNLLVFSSYELSNLIAFLFPIYIAMYIQNSYVMAGSVNAVSKVAILIFVFIYGKVIKKRNYFILSTVLSLLLYLSKLFFLNYFILVIYFVEGFIGIMQNQSANKIYFENRNGVDLTHYNLIYQILESVVRSIVVIPLFFINDIKYMILFVVIFISCEILIYSFMKKEKKLQ